MQKKKDYVKKYILKCATHLFFKKGYENTTISDIAKDAEFTRRTIYSYFQSKDEILVEVLIRSHLKAIDFIENRCSKTSGIAKVNEFIKAYSDFFLENSEILNLSLNLSIKDRIDPGKVESGKIANFREISRNLFKSMYEGLKEASEKGEVDKDLDLFKTIHLFWLTYRMVLLDVVQGVYKNNIGFLDFYISNLLKQLS